MQGASHDNNISSSFPWRKATLSKTIQKRRFVLVTVVFVVLFVALGAVNSQPAISAETRKSASKEFFPMENRDICQAVNAALMKYKTDIVDPYLYTGLVPDGGRQLTFRAMSAEKSGFGSNVKGLVTMLMFALVLRKPLVVESDCPQMGRFYESDIVIIQPAVPAATSVAPRKCEAFLGWLENATAQRIFESGDMTRLILSSSVDDAVFCDRHFVHLVQKFAWIQRDFGSQITQMKPRDLAACLFNRAFTLLSPMANIVQKALRPWSAAAFKAAMAGKAPPHLITVQIRLGGAVVPWEDPVRFADFQLYMSCLFNITAPILKGLREAELRDTDSTPSYFVFVSADSRAAFKAVTAAIPPDRRIEFMPDHFAHSARSYRLDRDVVQLSDEKTVGDFEILSLATLSLFSRSSFGEVPAWLAATRRSHFPALPKAVRKRLRDWGTNSTLLNRDGACWNHMRHDCSRETC